MVERTTLCVQCGHKYKFNIELDNKMENAILYWTCYTCRKRNKTQI